MVRVNSDIYRRLQNDPSCIRNICIVAHVDHGKTSLSDSLLASNGIISQKLAGKVRFLDSRPDEQLRGITMESSAISLYFRVLHKQENSDVPLVNEHLINLIDSPGHIDFSSEVNTASRLCDGALVLVDVIEGVCSQTVTVLRQCWTEKLKPVLVLNKIDRLITEIQLSPQEAYTHLSKIIEQVNSVLGSFYAGQRQLDDYSWREELEKDENAKYVELDDADLYFDPSKNNVIFASAVDGWGFNINQMSKFYAAKLGAKRENLQKVLWGDYYMDPKSKKIISGKALKGRSLKPLFVSLVLESIWKIYENVVMERNMEVIEKITKTLDITLQPRDLRSKDDKQLLKTILGQWLPVSTAILLTVVEKLPSPFESQKIRLDTILGAYNEIDKIDPPLLKGMESCDSQGPLVAYVSKILSIPKEELPVKAGESLSENQIFERNKQFREAAPKAAQQAELAEKVSKLELQGNKDKLDNLYERVTETVVTPEVSTGQINTSNSFSNAKDKQTSFKEESNEDSIFEVSDETAIPDFVPQDIDPNDPMASLFEYEEEDPFESNVPEVLVETEESEDEEENEALIGFTRIYSGSLKIGQTVAILGPKYDPQFPDLHIQTTVITDLYLFMGRELVPLETCPAGNIVGVGGLAGKLLKNGTLVDPGVNGVNLATVSFQTKPIVRVAIEPANPMQMKKLVRGLKLLEQADPCVETYVEASGEHILCCAGELHLERCLKDLKERFAGIEITSSEPAIPYKETFISLPDMNPMKNQQLGRGVIETILGSYKLKIRTLKLSSEVVKFFNTHTLDIERFLLKRIESHDHDSMNKTSFMEKLSTLLSKHDSKYEALWKDLDSLLVTIGPKKNKGNLFLAKDNLLDSEFNSTIGSFDFSDSIVNAFQLAVSEGPLAKEPVEGMCVILEDIHEMSDEEIESIEDPNYQRDILDLSGRLITFVRDSIHESFLDWSPRIMWAMYSCDIQASMEVLGKVYAVVQQRQGKIVSEEMKEGTPFFQIEAHIPVVSAFGFSEDIRKKTSGAAQPQLVFSGFECINLDPFWVPTTEEELEELGDTADKENIARKHMNMVRRRKGLFVDEKVIQSAEKQRTLKRN